MTEKEKMLSSRIYDTCDKELASLRTTAHRLCQLYNNTFEDEAEKREKILDQLLPDRGENVFFQGPIYFDYGMFTHIGKCFYANFNLTILDCCDDTIGDNVLIGPNCSLVTPVHPLRYQDRNIRFRPDGTPFDYEFAKPITIGDNCWIATNVTIIGGVTVGCGSVIGAGSVVTKDIPPHSLAAGNPCRIIREITEHDAIELQTELF